MARAVPTPKPVGLTAGTVASAMGGALVRGDARCEFGGVSIDSRTTKAGDLFVAIAGERFDGHTFVAAAVAAGAAGVVVATTSAADAAGDVCVIHVADTTRALQDLARHVRRACGARVVGITGSAGKTTVKELTADLLSQRYGVFRSQGNLNNHIGLPLSLLNLRRGYEVAVVELGMNHAGEISVLTAIAEPDVRVWLNVAEVHAEFFPSVDAIADAKAEILEGATSDTLVVANAGDPRVMARVRRSPARIVTFGLNVEADVSARDVRDLGIAGSRALVTTASAEAVFVVPLIGLGHLSNALAAAAVALAHGVPLADIAARLALATPASRRGVVTRLRGDGALIDDSYNSNPRALERMLEALAATDARGRRLAVLGEMLELGALAAPQHEACGRAAARAGLSGLIAVGGAAAGALAAGAVAGGMPAGLVVHVATSEQAADHILATMGDGDVVLVKGSRGIRTDVVSDRIATAWRAADGA